MERVYGMNIIILFDYVRIGHMLGYIAAVVLSNTE